jgi:hypothetical protein
MSCWIHLMSCSTHDVICSTHDMICSTHFMILSVFCNVFKKQKTYQNDAFFTNQIYMICSTHFELLKPFNDFINVQRTKQRQKHIKNKHFVIKVKILKYFLQIKLICSTYFMSCSIHLMSCSTHEMMFSTYFMSCWAFWRCKQREKHIKLMHFLQIKFIWLIYSAHFELLYDLFNVLEKQTTIKRFKVMHFVIKAINCFIDLLNWFHDLLNWFMNVF